MVPCLVTLTVAWFVSDKLSFLLVNKRKKSVTIFMYVSPRNNKYSY